jgi:acetolactate synthase-1/3 small subunit
MVTFARAVGLIRRRGFPVHALAVGPTNAPGLSRLTIMMQSDEATAERAVQHLQKIVGVHAAMALPPEGMVARELALVKLRAPVERYAELLDVVQLYHGAVVDESADVLIVELKNARFCKYIVDVTRLPFHSAQQRRRDRQDEAATVA